LSIAELLWQIKIGAGETLTGQGYPSESLIAGAKTLSSIYGGARRGN
jgi:hypothetical protein